MFNKRLKSYSKEKGYILSEKGLFHNAEIGDNKLIGEKIRCYSEE